MKNKFLIIGIFVLVALAISLVIGNSVNTGNQQASLSANIRSFFGFRSAVTTVNPFIQITSPKKGDVWVIGNKQLIQWNSSGVNSVDINLRTGTSTINIVKKYPFSVDAARSYAYTVPNLMEGRNYQISMIGYSAAQKVVASGTSGFFSIAKVAVEQGVYFKFKERQTADTFIFKLTNPSRIQEARAIIASGSTTTTPHVGGIIVKSKATYNAPWHYSLDPKSVYFFSNAMEVCDASIRYVEDHLNDVGGSLLPGNRWCNWSSVLIEELVPISI